MLLWFRSQNFVPLSYQSIRGETSFIIILNFSFSITQEKRRRAKEDMSAMEEEMAAASAQMKAREEENLTKQTPSVRLVNLVL